MFTEIDFQFLLNKLKGCQIRTLEESYGQLGVVNIRHDVDDNLDAALEMALIEKKNGISSTYFFLDTADYWHTNGLVRVVSMINIMGHKVGWHNNALANYLRSGDPLKVCIERPLKRLRRIARVIGTASHGDPLCHKHKFLNYYVFEEAQEHPKFWMIPDERYPMRDFKLEYEAYHTNHTHYLSDAGGKWNTDPENIIKDYKVNGGKLQINIHPQWWHL